jgi:hypothetical protein
MIFSDRYSVNAIISHRVYTTSGKAMLQNLPKASAILNENKEFGSKAEVTAFNIYGRFTPESGHQR